MNNSYSNGKAVYKIILFNVLTFGIYRIYWIYKTWKYIGQIQNRQINAGTRTFLMFVPFVNIFVLYKLYKNINSILKTCDKCDTLSPGWGIVLSLLVYVIIDALYQHNLNKYWLYKDNLPIQKGLTSKEIVLTVLSIPLWILYIIIVVIITALSASDLDTTSTSRKIKRDKTFQTNFKNSIVKIPMLINFFPEENFSIRLPGKLIKKDGETYPHKYSLTLTDDEGYYVAVTDLDIKENILSPTDISKIQNAIVKSLKEQYETMSEPEPTFSGMTKGILIRAEKDGFFIKKGIFIHKGKVYEISYVYTNKAQVNTNFDVMIKTLKFL
ncbi:MAG: hypothetical protein WCO06_05555 [Candidatus Roizmanbacteria bacterium]